MLPLTEALQLIKYMSLSQKRRNPISLSLSLSLSCHVYLSPLYVRENVVGFPPMRAYLFSFSFKRPLSLFLSLPHCQEERKELLVLVLVLATATYIDPSPKPSQSHQSALASYNKKCHLIVFQMGIVPSTIETPLYPNYLSIYTCRPLHLSPSLSLSLSLSLYLEQLSPTTLD